jgi:hypothetical protein
MKQCITSHIQRQELGWEGEGIENRRGAYAHHEPPNETVQPGATNEGATCKIIVEAKSGIL